MKAKWKMDYVGKQSDLGLDRRLTQFLYWCFITFKGKTYGIQFYPFTSLNLPFKFHSCFVFLWILCPLQARSYVLLAFLSQNSDFFFFFWYQKCPLSFSYLSIILIVSVCLSWILFRGWLWYPFGTYVLSCITMNYMCVWACKVLENIDVFLYLYMSVSLYSDLILFSL